METQILHRGSSAPRLAIVVPCYNEEPMLRKTADVLGGVISGLKTKGKAGGESFILFVDDGSADATWRIIKDLSAANPALFKGLKLSRNFGHQSAILAGMLAVKGEVDCLITIDADLQDDVSVMETFVDRYREGVEIVYGVKRKRDEDTFFKRNTALFFYRLMGWLGTNAIYNHADFRLVGSRALDALAGIEEVNLFLRGIFPLLGYKMAVVEFDRKAREAGETKYTLSKMIGLALDGITAFSVRPLRLITIAGIIVFLFSLGMSAWVLYIAFRGEGVPGWASTVVTIYFLGGIHMISLGIIGEYIGKIYKEVKRRPRFIVEERVG